MGDVALTILLVFASICTVTDLWRRLIPNFVVIVALSAATLLAFFGYSKPAEAAAGLSAGFGFFFILYLLSLVGGGDVKMVAAASAFVPLAYLAEFLLYTVVCGAAFGLLFAIWDGRGGQLVLELRGLLGKVFSFPGLLSKQRKEAACVSGSDSSSEHTRRTTEQVQAPFAPGLLIAVLWLFGLPSYLANAVRGLANV